jgi:hypothetical protein
LRLLRDLKIRGQRSLGGEALGLGVRVVDGVGDCVGVGFEVDGADGEVVVVGFEVGDRVLQKLGLALNLESVQMSDLALVLELTLR